MKKSGKVVKRILAMLMAASMSVGVCGNVAFAANTDTKKTEETKVSESESRRQAEIAHENYLASHEPPEEGIEYLIKPNEFSSGDYEIGHTTLTAGSTPGTNQGMAIWVPKFYTDFDRTSWWFEGAQELREKGIIMGDQYGRANYNDYATVGEIYTMIVRYVLSNSFAGEEVTAVTDDSSEEGETAIMGDYVFNGRHAWQDAFTTVHTYLGDTLWKLGITDFSITPSDMSYVPTRQEAYAIYALGALAMTTSPKWYMNHFSDTRLGYMKDVEIPVRTAGDEEPTNEQKAALQLTDEQLEALKDREITVFYSDQPVTEFFTEESIIENAAEMDKLQIQSANLLMYLGVLNGKQDKDLHNSDSLTRAEAAKLLQSISNILEDPNYNFKAEEEKQDPVIQYVWVYTSSGSAGALNYWKVQWAEGRPVADAEGNTPEPNILAWTYSESKEDLPTYPGGAPTKHDMAFTGWSTPEIDEENKVITLYANWVESLDVYNLTYQLDGGEIQGEPNPTTYQRTTETFTLKNPVKAGYIFAGWTGPGLSGVTETVTITTGSTGDREYTAVWNEPPKVEIVQSPLLGYSITYDLDGGVLTKNNPSWYYETSSEFTLNNPQKTGYIFTGWAGTGIDTPTMEVKVATGTKGDLSFVAHWEAAAPGVYTIVYHVNGGIVGLENPTTYTAETADFQLSNPEKIGYTFVGWSGTGITDKSTSVTVAQGSTGNREYFANYEIDTYTIQYDLDGGSVVASNPENYNVLSETITLVNPTRAGYVFNGWTGTGLADARATVVIPKGSVGNRSYTATWVAESAAVYTINYNLGNGVLVQANPATYTSETPTFTLSNPTREGYEFLGWVGTGLTAPNGNVVITVGSSGNREYTATWGRLTYTIAYDLDGGAVVHNNPTYYDVTTETFTLSNPTKAGFVFAGWVGTDLASATVTVNVEKGSTGNRAYKATWNVKAPDAFTIIYHLNGGTLAVDNPTSYYETTPTFVLNNPEKEGYDFVGWVGTGINVPTMSMSVAQGTVGNLDFTAIYQAKLYKITYDLAGGTISGNNPTAYYASTSDFTLINPTKAGYVFAGWLGTGLSGATATVTIAEGSSGNRSYTATWQAAAPGSYTITYHLDGGSVDGTNPALYTTETADFTLSNPTKSGYKFVGWAGTDLDSPKETVTITQGSSGDREYTAIYELIAYTITYDLTGGALETNNTSLYYANTPTFSLNNPTKKGYVFAGWLGTGLDAATVDVSVAKGSTGNRAYQATWTEADPDEYTITYFLQGGSVGAGANPTTYTAKDASFTLVNPIKAGSNFLGWAGTGLSDTTSTVTIATGSTGDRAYTAIWEVKNMTSPEPNDPNRLDGSLLAENAYEALYLNVPNLILNGTTESVDSNLHLFKLFYQGATGDPVDVSGVVEFEPVKGENKQYTSGSYGGATGLTGARMRITPKTTVALKSEYSGDALDTAIELRNNVYDIIEDPDTAAGQLALATYNVATGLVSGAVPIEVPAVKIVWFSMLQYGITRDSNIKLWVKEGGAYTDEPTVEFRTPKAALGVTENFLENLKDAYLTMENTYGTLDKPNINAPTSVKAGTNLGRSTYDFVNDWAYNIMPLVYVTSGTIRHSATWSATVAMCYSGLEGKTVKIEVSQPGFISHTQEIVIPDSASFTDGLYQITGFSYPTNYVWYDGYYDARGDYYIDEDSNVPEAYWPETGETNKGLFDFQKTLVMIPDPNGDGVVSQADVDMLLKYGWVANPENLLYIQRKPGLPELSWGTYSTTFNKDGMLWNSSIYNMESEQGWNDYKGDGTFAGNIAFGSWSPILLLRVANQNIEMFGSMYASQSSGFDSYLGKIINVESGAGIPQNGVELATGYEYDVVRQRPILVDALDALGLRYDSTLHTVVTK